jgi:methionyl-tRNA formyltransferase
MTGVSVFQLEKGLDTGPIFAQETLEIEPSWRSFELLGHLAELGPSVVQRSLEMIKNGESPKAQAGAVSIAAKIEKAEARLDFTKDLTHISNAVRAFTYEPGSWTLWRGGPFKICSTGKSNSSMGTPGEVSIVDKSVFVSCGNGSLEILRVVPAGKKEMDAIDWARGARLNIGEVFG